MRTLPLLLLLLPACTNVLSGESGFTSGQAHLVPCTDKPGALLVVESLQECWISAPGERLACPQWREFVNAQPEICTDEIVFDSPSTNTLTAFLDEPIDVTDLRGAATTQVFDLPCNPRGPGATEYPDFTDFLGIYTGDVRVTADNGANRARVELELYQTSREGQPMLDRPALDGTITANICR